MTTSTWNRRSFLGTACAAVIGSVRVASQPLAGDELPPVTHPAQPMATTCTNPSGPNA